MLPALVLVAEGLVAVWFAVFSVMLTSMYLDSRALPTPRLDLTGRTLIGSAKIAFFAGLIALAVLTGYEIAQMFM